MNISLKILKKKLKMPNITLKGKLTSNKMLVNNLSTDTITIDNNVNDETPWPPANLDTIPNAHMTIHTFFFLH